MSKAYFDVDINAVEDQVSEYFHDCHQVESCDASWWTNAVIQVFTSLSTTLGTPDTPRSRLIGVGTDGLSLPSSQRDGRSVDDGKCGRGLWMTATITFVVSGKRTVDGQCQMWVVSNEVICKSKSKRCQSWCDSRQGTLQFRGIRGRLSKKLEAKCLAIGGMVRANGHRFLSRGVSLESSSWKGSFLMKNF